MCKRTPLEEPGTNAILPGMCGGQYPSSVCFVVPPMWSELFVLVCAERERVSIGATRWFGSERSATIETEEFASRRGVIESDLMRVVTPLGL